MTVFDQLEQAIVTAQNEEEFPDYLAAIARNIIAEKEYYASRTDEVAELITLVQNYDTYADTGCEQTGASRGEIERKLILLMGKERFGAVSG